MRHCLKVMKMDDGKLLMYHMVCKMMTEKVETRHNWEAKTSSVLYGLQLVHYWIIQHADSGASHLCCLKECLIERVKEKWANALQRSQICAS